MIFFGGMLMLKTLSGYIGEYRRPAFLCVLLTAMEAVTSILIPYIMSNIIDKGINQRNMSAILGYGFLMIALSLLSFVCGFSFGCLHIDYRVLLWIRCLYTMNLRFSCFLSFIKDIFAIFAEISFIVDMKDIVKYSSLWEMILPMNANSAT